tara:strand:+ start:207 stop:389 length:183 start_codon:yes stop_codon:yes gene_type:complete
MEQANLNVRFGPDTLALLYEIKRVAALTYQPVSQLTRKYIREGLKNDPVANKFKSHSTNH